MVDPRSIYERFQDHEAFCRESLVVENKNGEIVPFLHGPAQTKLHEAIRKQRERGKPVRIIYLKARQVWVSVGTAGEFFHHTPFVSGQHAAVIAHDEDTALNLFKHYERFAKKYKPFSGAIRLPRQTKAADGAIEWENGSWIKVATARNLNFGRSFTLRRVHFSEFGFYQNAQTLMTSLMQAVPKDPDTMVVIESTANGVGNEFHKMWLRANDPAIESEWIPVFFAWWEHPEYTLPLTMPADRFQHSLDKEELEMFRKYNLTLEQLYWRRWIIANDLNGDKVKFRQEYPSCPEEAFLASGRMRFDVQSVGRMPVQREAVQGGLEVNQVGIERRLAFLPRERGELTIFRKPVAGRQYIIGADTSEGIDANGGKGEADPDFSCAQVVDRDTGEQVGVLRARMQPSPFGAYVVSLGVWYNMASIVVEVNSIGVATVDEMLRRDYPTHLFYHRRREADRDPWERSDFIGWKSTTVTRPQLISHLDTALREISISVHDPVTIQELMTFVIGVNGKAEAQSGCHDDTVIALGLCVIGILEMPRAPLPPPPGKERREGRDAGARGKLLRLRPR